MKWSILGLLVLGIIAALCATIFVSSLLANAHLSSNKLTEDTTVDILIASRDIPGLAMISTEDVMVKNIDREAAPKGYLSDPVQVIGKVLILPMKKQQAFLKDDFASEGSGLHLAATLPTGKRAASVAISAHTGLSGLLYPGSVIDVIASFRMPGQNHSRSEAVSFTLLQNVQVLAIESDTIVSSDNTTPKQETSRLGKNPNKRLMVTLLVDSRQAKSLQLAAEYGSLSVTMRNPLDNSTADSSITLLSDLAERSKANITQEHIAQVLKNLGKTEEAGTAQQQAPEDLSTDDLDNADSNGMTINQWLTTIIRGSDIQTQSFDLEEQTEEQL